jgi:hypothetical protein
VTGEPGSAEGGDERFDQHLLQELPARSEDAQAKCLNPFLYIEESILPQVELQGWTRDELLLYVLHCRGYSKQHRCSLMGEKAARITLGLTKAVWERANDSLVKRGWITRVSRDGSKRPLTCIAGGRNPFSPSGEGERTAKSLDGHRYIDVASERLVKVPCTLVDGSADGAAPTLADLETAGSILLLLSMYGFARGDGVLPLRDAWMAEHDDALVVRLSRVAADESWGDATQLQLHAEELLRIGLLYAGVQGVGGKWVLHLCHPMEPARLVA